MFRIVDTRLHISDEDMQNFYDIKLPPIVNNDNINYNGGEDESNRTPKTIFRSRRGKRS